MSNIVLKWLIVFAIGLGIVATSIFFFGGSSFSEGRVNFTIDGPSQASVGDEVVYKVQYENTTNTTLHNITLVFTYPENSVVLGEGGSVMGDTDVKIPVQTTEIGTLEAGAKGEEEYHAFLVGDKGNILVAKASLRFTAGSLKSNFEKTANRATTITSLPVALTLSAPPTASSGDTVTYTLDYRNQSQSAISGIQIIFDYPDGFTPRSYSPQPSSGKTTWAVSNLAVGQGKRITVTGTLNGRENESKPVVVNLQRSINENDQYINYESANATTVISSPLLSVSLSVNGSTTYTSHVGDTLQYEVDYKNNSTSTISGLTLSTHLDGAMYDFASIDPKTAFFDASTKTITWNSTIVPALGNLAPNQSGTVAFNIKLKSTIGSSAGSGNSFVRATSQLSTQNVPSGVDSQELIVGSELVTKITSQPVFVQSAYYNDASFGSSGVWPPKAGSETAITVHWKISNPGNDLSGAKVTATLPQGVTWKNATSVTAGQPEPTFNKSSSQITWNLGVVPQGVGTTTGVYELVFQVGVKPSQTQAGLPMTVLQSSALSGADSFTKQSIVVPAPDVTTNTIVDQPGNGVVQP